MYKTVDFILFSMKLKMFVFNTQKKSRSFKSIQIYTSNPRGSDKQYLTASSVLAFIWYVLLNPGWSRSWQIQAVRRTQRSRLLRLSMRRHPCIKTYLGRRVKMVIIWFIISYSHHLTHTEAVSEVVEWVVAIILLNSEQKPEIRRCFSKIHFSPPPFQC